MANGKTIIETGVKTGEIDASVITTEVSVVTSDTAVSSYNTVISNSASVLTHTLPAVAGIAGREYTVKNIGSAPMILAADGAETIDGNATVTLLTNDSITVRAYASGWAIV